MSATRIPNRFHFIYGLKRHPERFHLAHYLCLASCVDVNRPEILKLHTVREPHGPWWERIRDRVTLAEIAPPEESSRLAYRDRYTRRFRYAHATDFLRLDVLIDEGGVYADLDTLFVNPLPQALFQRSFVIGREPEIVDGDGVARASLCNALLMAEPGARFARAWREGMEAAFDGSWSRHSTILPEQLSRELPDAVHIEPQRSFYRHVWSRAGLADLFERRVDDFDGVYSMHLWAHLWWSRLRRDYSRFHAGRLNEDYVRHADTTYAIAARRFLP